MYRRFADGKLLCGGADRGPVLYDVKSQAFRPLFHVSFQNTTLPASCWSILCGTEAGYEKRDSYESLFLKIIAASNSLATNRHDFAHGKTPTATFHDIKNYYFDVLELIKIFDSVVC